LKNCFSIELLSPNSSGAKISASAIFCYHFHVVSLSLAACRRRRLPFVSGKRNGDGKKKISRRRIVSLITHTHTAASSKQGNYLRFQIIGISFASFFFLRRAKNNKLPFLCSFCHPIFFAAAPSRAFK